MPIEKPHRAPRPAHARFARAVLPATLVVLSTAGCATPDEVRYGSVAAVPSAYEASSYAVQQPLSLGEIVAALRAGRSSHDLAGDVDERGLLAPITSADIDLLLQSGADAELIDAVRDASSLAGRGIVQQSPPVTVSPPVIVTPPMYQSYGWYPYAPYAPYSFEFWYHDVPRYRAPRFRHDPGHDRWRRDHGRDDRARDRSRPGAQQNWQSPRVSPAPAPGARDSIRPGGSPRMSPGASPRATPQAPSSGAVRDRRIID